MGLGTLVFDWWDKATFSTRWFTLRNMLVVVQVAVSVVVLVSGALLVRSLDVANRVDLGYDIDRTAYMVTSMEMNGYSPEEARAFLETGRLRLEQLPEVEAVGLASRLPLSLNNNGFGVFIDGPQTSGTDRPYIMDGASIDEGYFVRHPPFGYFALHKRQLLVTTNRSFSSLTDEH